ncbi:hypothetical protein [Streptomyces alfalfae]
MNRRLRHTIAALAILCAAAAPVLADDLTTASKDTAWGAGQNADDTAWGTPPTTPSAEDDEDDEDGPGSGQPPTENPNGDTAWG